MVNLIPLMMGGGGISIEFIGASTVGATQDEFTLDISDIDIQDGDIGILAITDDQDESSYTIEIDGEPDFTLIHRDTDNKPQDYVLSIVLTGGESEIYGQGNDWVGPSVVFAVFRNALQPTTSTRDNGSNGDADAPDVSFDVQDGTSCAIIIGHVDDDEDDTFLTNDGYSEAGSVAGNNSTTLVGYKLNMNSGGDEWYGSTRDDEWAAHTIELKLA